MQERLKILELLAEGKLTAEQADLLLEALEEKSQPKGDGKAAWDRAAAELKSFGAQLSSVLTQSVSEIRRGLETNLTNLSFGDTLAVTYEHEFANDVERIRIESANGRIRVEQWSQPYIRMYVQADVRTDEQDKAKEILEQAVQTTVIGNDASVRLLNRWDGAKIYGGRIDLYVPEGLDRLALHTKNGAIFIDHVNANNILLETINGQIHVHHVNAQSLRTTTQNGGIQLHHAIQANSQEIYAESKNGAIALRGLPSDVLLRGQAKSLMGIVQVSNPAYEVHYEQDRKNICTFESDPQTESEASPISVYLESKNGKISVQ
ncbi:SHOCT-like domain-containing protein [Alicyclobacillus dauci]|uniref:DUF4097 family beta strand repeat-containing protein n=1 Tax=Alicyclobacillus dauci TaxID=1475485 RepID=A0ABY6Z897_9BACL|nr:DUF4097 family beta strand repeat-containing protein [Alicyclobacillus dauci]WAH38481.1 DUF4097 family beta strand repeat-containing protein [Alicyclobacillus dauci]